jgi:hypothetical protein
MKGGRPQSDCPGDWRDGEIFPFSEGIVFDGAL